jgi:predicted lipid carrier protein YhbT
MCALNLFFIRVTIIRGDLWQMLTVKNIPGYLVSGLKNPCDLAKAFSDYESRTQLS